jgi:hypothetical protein
MTAAFPSFDPSLLPQLGPAEARALLPVMLEKVMQLELPAEQARAFFNAFLERLRPLLNEDAPPDEPWNRWFALCDSFEPTADKSYLDILEDPERR